MSIHPRQILDALPNTVWSVDLDGIITAVNKSWSDFASGNGAPQIAAEQSVVGTSIFSAIADRGTRQQILDAMHQLREGARLVRWEFPCDSPDEERVFLMHVTAAYDDATHCGYVFSTVDITPSHRSREALINTGIALAEAISLDRVYQQVATQLRRAIPSTGLAIGLLDDDSADLAIVHHEGFEESGGSAAKSALESRLIRPWLDALARHELVRDETEFGCELTAPLMSPQGTLGAVTLRCSRSLSPQEIDEAERVLTVVGAQTGVAIERAWLVRRVEQKRRLEAIGEVAAGVAHELRNPLFGISSAAQLLRFRVSEDAVVDKNVGRILREVERLNRMVTSLLEFGRPHTVHAVPGNPDAVWDDILDGERARLETGGLRLERSRASAAEVRCRIDPGQFGQVLRNVLVNAIDAAPAGSTLVLQSHALPNGGWRCRLTNGGPIIPPEVLAHVFEFFYSTKPGGTGIGLALCQRIMEEHGGSITLDSAEDVGTTVTISLPPAD